jgi:hypothetical protein
MAFVLRGPPASHRGRSSRRQHLFDALVLRRSGTFLTTASAAIERGADLPTGRSRLTRLASRFRRILRSRSVAPVLRERRRRPGAIRVRSPAAFFQQRLSLLHADEHTRSP